MSDDRLSLVDWALTDPAGKGVDDLRPIRDEIDRRVRELLAELGPSAESRSHRRWSM